MIPGLCAALQGGIEATLRCSRNDTYVKPRRGVFGAEHATLTPRKSPSSDRGRWRGTLRSEDSASRLHEVTNLLPAALTSRCGCNGRRRSSGQGYGEWAG